MDKALFGANIFKFFVVFLPLLFLFLQSFYIPGTNIPFYDIIIGIALFIMLIIYPRIYVQFFKNNDLYNKILVLYISWVILSGFFLVFTGINSFLNFLYGVFALFLYNNFTWYIYPAILVPRFLSLKKLIKYLLIAIYLVCLYGILVYLFDKMHLPILEPIQNIIVNRREFISSTRLLSVFEEPGFMGGFVCISIPIVYNTVLSKFKIFKNKNLNSFFKLSFIPLYVLTILLVQSPIWLIIFIIINFIYFYKLILKHTKILFIILFTVMLLSPLIGTLSEMSNSLSGNSRGLVTRIVNFVDKFGNDLVYIDESLATRIIGYNSRIQIFKQHPITGVGYKNTENHVFKIFSTGKYILTTELREKMYNITSNNKYIVVSGAILWNALSDTGIVGTLLYYLFVILSILKLHSIDKKLPDMFIKYFIRGLKQTYLLLICLSFYDIRSNFIYFWFLFGMLVPCVNYYEQFYNKINYLLIHKGEKNEY